MSRVLSLDAGFGFLFPGFRAGRKPSGGPAESDMIVVMSEIDAGGVAEDEWDEWRRLTPEQRFLESMKLWETYLALGGSLEPEPDTQSPFFDPEEWRENHAHGRPSVRVLRRGGV